MRGASFTKRRDLPDFGEPRLYFSTFQRQFTLDLHWRTPLANTRLTLNTKSTKRTKTSEMHNISCLSINYPADQFPSLMPAQRQLPAHVLTNPDPNPNLMRTLKPSTQSSMHTRRPCHARPKDKRKRRECKSPV